MQSLDQQDVRADVRLCYLQRKHERRENVNMTCTALEPSGEGPSAELKETPTSLINATIHIYEND